jgi:two-component system cell cycle sensor histidine kinase/response regulator CckA
MSDRAGEQIQRFHDRLKVVSEAAKAFADATTDYERLLDEVARILSEVLGDSCAVFLLDEGGASMRPVALHAVHPAALEAIRRTFAETPLLLHEQPALRQILATGVALLVPRLDPKAARSDTTPAQVEAQRRLGLHSFLVVALRAHGRAMGVISLGRFRPEAPPFEENDRELAQNLADHASLAIENGQLYQAARTARREAEQAEEAVRRSEATHLFFFESSPLATFIFDVESLRIVAANAAASELYGYSREELLALGLDDLRAPEDRAQLAQALLATHDAVVVGTARHRRKDGRIIHVEGRNHLTSLGGRPVRYVVVLDQTGRHEAEAAKLESEGRLQRTIDNMMEGYTILGHDLRYLYVNRVAAQQARLEKEQLLGRTPMELYPNFEASGMYALLQRCIHERAPVQVEEELTLADGHKVHFEVNVQPTPEGLAILSIDTTERRRAAEARESLEEQLRQSQRMDAVGRLAGGVAHDFNNILSIIIGYGECLLRDLAAGDPRRADMLEIQSAAERAAQLTKQLLLFSRQQVLELRVLDLNAVIGGIEKMLRRVLGEDLELCVVLGPGLGRIRADQGNIEQVIMNLVVNARDAMPSGGRLTMETADVSLDEVFVRAHLDTEPGPYVMLAVTDTGVGMDKATRLRVFDPFFTTKERGKGTGLGLSTVFGIVRQLGGGIFVYSEPGRGTTFKVYLPRSEGEVDSPRSPSPTVSLHGTETILLVEDDEAVRAVARRILERTGYRVIVAQDTADALRLPEHTLEPVHLLLTDLVMPGMSGVELATRLMARWPELKVLYMSGYTDGSIVSHGVSQRGASFLQKPFTSEQLGRKLRSVLDGDRPIAPDGPA